MFCRQHGFKLRIVDVGVDYDFVPNQFPAPQEDETNVYSPPLLGEGLGVGSLFLDRKIARGTKNFLYEPAMSEEEFDKAIQIGSDLVDDCIAEGCRILCIGEMGIGNTSPSSIWLSLFGNYPLSDCIGAGAGLDTPGIRHKYEVLSKAVERFTSHGDRHACDVSDLTSCLSPCEVNLSTALERISYL